ncbi:MAG: hypothetical protein B6D59_08005 [Campylobacteraceae bacterium 4484_4]|nr:MAG: hypothetical protein B6D59_08005 [Campylobacteraceae bacterium 4484_4]
MRQAKAGISLLAVLLPLLLNATFFIKNDLITPKAATKIEEIGDELSSKTGVNLYVMATNEHFSEGLNLVAYSKKYESNISKPYVILIFAPNALITAKSQEKGRVAIIPSSKELASLYDKGSVIDATIDVVAAKDKNSKRDKYNIGVVQGYSELADQIADAKGIEMTRTIPNETRTIIGALKYLVILGTILVLWILVIRPIVMRIKYGK